MSAHPVRRILLGMLLCMLSTTTLAPAPAIAAEGSSLGLRPVDQTDWFRFAVARGESVKAEFDVVNRTSETRNVRLYAVDALITPQGGFALRENKEARSGVGAWMKIERASVVAEPNSTTRVKLWLTVPTAAEPGDYAGGVIAEMDPRMGESGDAGSKTHVQFNLVERVGIRTYLRVEGEAVRRADVVSFERRRVDGGSEFVVKVRNTGTLGIKPQGSIRLAGFGAGASTLVLKGPETLLPGGVGEYTAAWAKEPLFAKVKASYEVRYDAASPVRGSLSFTLIAWHVVAIALAVLLLVAFAVRQTVRFVRRARHALRMIEDSGPSAVRDGEDRATSRDSQSDDDDLAERAS